MIAKIADPELARSAARTEFKTQYEASGHVPQNPGAEESLSRSRHFLLVSMPFGPFGRELAANLRFSGARTTRVLLNAGDLLDWGFRDAIPFFRPWSEWGDWLRTLIRRARFTDLVTYGDSSPQSDLALRIASELHITTHVLEQGYFRPDWVTLETNGVNANSSLPRKPSWYRNHPSANHPVTAETVGRATPAAVRHIVAYHLAMYLGFPFFPRYRAHYTDSAVKQAFGHVARYGIRPLTRRHSRRAYEKVLSGDGPVFLCALQRPGDSQLWRHSDYASIPDFINRVVTSFAAHATANAKLIIRPHPLDPGLVRYKSIISRVARDNGVEGRVYLTDYGKLHDVLPRMAGVVCINSTAGLAAIEFGKPTITLGRAIYDMPGMTHQGDLDEFWTAAQQPDASLYAAFRQVVIAKTQVNGAYATARGRKLAVPEITRRLLAAV